jgi:transcriptional/translational regulatory protein YebC/TACO1
MFAQKGIAIIEGEVEEEKLLEACLEADADSYDIIDEEDYQGVEVFTTIDQLENLNQILTSHHFTVKEVELRWIPNNSIEISDQEQTKYLLRLMDSLESLDDVQNVTANFELVEND